MIYDDDLCEILLSLKTLENLVKLSENHVFSELLWQFLCCFGHEKQPNLAVFLLKLVKAIYSSFMKVFLQSSFKKFK